VKISIVTPSFNQAEYLEDTLLSVVEQKYPDLEYFVIDGGSKDGSVEIIKKYQHQLNYWVSEPDKGHYSAINKGFRMATGEIMGWINSSDGYYPWTFEIIAEIFSSFPEVQWISGCASYFDIGRVPRGVEFAKYRNRFDFLSGNCTLQQESLFWRKNLWEAAGSGLDETLKYAADTDLWFRFFQLARLYNVNTLLAGFRYHGDRRGESEGKYHDEVQMILHYHRNKASFQDRYHAIQLAQCKNSHGIIFRKVMQHFKLWPWDLHFRIARDFNSQKWVIRK
jgi:glycosyltransferase involved in cell wall biosynthesis